MKRGRTAAVKRRPETRRQEKQFVELSPEQMEALRGGITSRHCSRPRELLCGHERDGQSLPD